MPPQEVHFETLSPWPHRLAIALVCMTFPLIWVGGLVTTYDAGMAVPDWPNTYGYNMFLYPWKTWWTGPWDLFIEHGHRLLASLVGLVTIAFVAVTWRSDRRLWFRYFSLVCLMLVIAQGVLGGLRVLLDENVLARWHGCLGPVFFAAVVSAAAMSSRWWRVPPGDGFAGNSQALQRLAWLTVAISYLQLVIGAHLRHVPIHWSPTTFRVVVLAHLFGAALLVTHVVLLAWKVSSDSTSRRITQVRKPVAWLCAAVLCQLVFGAAAWRVKYDWPEGLPQPALLDGYTITAEGMFQTITITLHVAMGSMILGLSVLSATRISRILASRRERPSLARERGSMKLEVVL